MDPGTQIITVLQGPGWREYIDMMPHPHMWPIGTVTVGTQLKGALVLDLDSQTYLLIDNAGMYFELEQAKVRAALGGE